MPSNLQQRTDSFTSVTTRYGAGALTPEKSQIESSVAAVARADAPIWLRKLGPIVSSRGLASIVDQSVMSATNFLTTVIIGRAAGQDALGAFSLAFSVVLIMTCVQDCAICQPYTVEHRRLKVTARREFAGSTLVQAALLSVILLTMTVIASMFVSGGSTLGPINLHLALAVATPFVLLRDFARRMSFAHLLVSRAVAVDGIVLILQLGALLVLWRLGWLSTPTAYLAIAGACAAAGIIWLWSFRDNFRAPGQRLLRDMRSGWSFGRWVLGSQVLSILRTYLIYWLVAAWLGTHASGVLTACSAIILLSNPIVFGTCTYLVPHLAAVIADEGDTGVLRVAVRTTLFLAAVMSVVCLAAFTLGDAFLHVVYGSSFTGNSTVSGLYGLSVLAQVIGSAPDYVLWVKHRPELSFWTGLLGLGCIAAVALCLMPAWGLVGAVFAMVIGNALTSVARWAIAMRLIGVSPVRVSP